MDQLLECQRCFTGTMRKPDDDHPAYLICPNCGALELTYQPQDYQEPMHTTPITLRDGRPELRIIFVAGGFGSGKSRATLAELLLIALENSGGTGLLTAPTLQLLKRTTLKTFFNEVCPPPLIESYQKVDGEIKLVNGFTFYTIPSDDEEKLRSINAGLVHIEEASGIKRSVYDQLLTRMRDPFVKNRTLFVCTNPDLGYVKEVFADNPKRKEPDHPEHDLYNPFIHTFIWPTKLNKHLPADFIEMNSVGKPEWWIKRYLQGSFEHSEGMVYPRFPETKIEPLPVVEGKTDRFGIPLNWERFVSLDHGLRNATAVLFYAIDPKAGVVYLYNEYYETNRLLPDHAKHLKPLIDEIPAGRLRFMVADPSIRNRTDPINGKSVQSLYNEYGMYFQPGNNNVEAGILKVNSYIERGRLKIYNTCTNTLKEGLNYKFKEQTMDNYNENLDERPVKAFDHAMDSLKYGMMRLPDDADLLKTVAYEPEMVYNRHVDIEYGTTDFSEYEGKDWYSSGY